MDSAARRPEAMAVTITSGPVTQSPPANTPATGVARVSSSTASVPQGLVGSPSFSTSGSCPTVTIAASAGSVNSEPGIGTGRGRPEASGSPRRMRCSTAPVSLPSPENATGPARNSKRTPSASAASTSAGSAGISARLRR
jgi:hypothetical protein